jgi:superfamily II DNA or RNA helicase
MLPIQNLAFQLCTNFAADEKNFLQYQTGQGKTALCLAIACYLNQLGRRVFIINDSQELTFRDYKKS